MRFPIKYVLLATLLSQSVYVYAETSSFACSSQLMVPYDHGKLAHCEGEIKLENDSLQGQTLRATYSSILRVTLNSDLLAINKVYLLPSDVLLSSTVLLTDGGRVDLGTPALSGSVGSTSLMTPGGQLVINGANSGNLLQLSAAGLPSANLLVSQVPEPRNVSMLLAGLLVLGLATSGKNKKS